MMAKKRYVAVRQVREFIADQPDECQAQYLAMIERLEQDGYLIEPFAKKLDKELFEIRIRRGRQVRVLYYYDDGDIVVGVHAFVKKTQKTPVREVHQARRVVSAIKRGEYDE
jgi:phage-related protein